MSAKVIVRETLKKVPGLRPAVIRCRTFRDRLVRRVFPSLLARSCSRQLASLRNIHKGQRAWIIGNGPSLTKLDLSLLKDEITFGVNGIWLLFDELGWKPKYYTVEDRFVAEDDAKVINEIHGPVKVFPEDLSDILKPDNNSIYVTFCRGYYPGFPKFSEHCDEIIYWGGTVTYMNMQLAHHMGCNPIYLIGMDMDYDVPDYREGNEILSREPDVNHFHPDYFGPGKRWHFPNVEQMIMCLEHAGQFLAKKNVAVFNATHGGKLESFPRVRYEEVFDKKNLHATRAKSTRPIVSTLTKAKGNGSGLMGRLKNLVRIESSPKVSGMRDDLKGKHKWALHALLAVMNRRPGILNVQLQTISACNGKCIMCPYPESWQQANPGRMSDEMLDKIYEQLRPMQLNRFCLYLENEPFLDNRLLDRLRQARDMLRTRQLHLATNAACLTREKCKELADILGGVSHEIWISFHGVDETSYTDIMGLDFHQSLSNIIELLQVAQARPLKIRIRSAGLSLHDGDKTEPRHFSKEQMHAFWKKLFDQHKIRKKPLLSYFAYHDRAGSIMRNEYNFEQRRPSLLGLYCDRGDEWLHVLYNGEVIFCCNDYHRKTVIGDLKTQSVKEVLRNSNYRDHRLMMMGLKSAPDDFICRTCIKPGG